MPPGMEPLKLFTTLAHHPEVLKLLRAMGNLVFKSGLLDASQREIVIQRVCARKGAEYEWGVHAKLFGAKFNLAGERLHSLTFDDKPGELFSTQEQVLIAAVDELCSASAEIGDANFERMRSAGFSDAQILEVAAVAGLYHVIAFLVRTSRVENETFAMTFDALRRAGG